MQIAVLKVRRLAFEEPKPVMFRYMTDGFRENIFDFSFQLIKVIFCRLYTAKQAIEFRASTSVVPEPQKGSTTICGRYLRRKISTSWGTNLPK